MKKKIYTDSTYHKTQVNIYRIYLDYITDYLNAYALIFNLDLRQTNRKYFPVGNEI